MGILSSDHIEQAEGKVENGDTNGAKKIIAEHAADEKSEYSLYTSMNRNIQTYNVAILRALDLLNNSPGEKNEIGVQLKLAREQRDEVREKLSKLLKAYLDN